MDEQDLRRVFSLNIRRYRNFRKLSQEKLAEKLDISIPFLSDIENGKKWVSPKTLVKIANALMVEAYELLRPEEKLPDKAANVLERYTADVYTLFSQSLETLSNKYISQLSEQQIQETADGV